jgi:hypothetical protein
VERGSRGISEEHRYGRRFARSQCASEDARMTRHCKLHKTSISTAQETLRGPYGDREISAPRGNSGSTERAHSVGRLLNYLQGRNVTDKMKCVRPDKHSDFSAQAPKARASEVRFSSFRDTAGRFVAKRQTLLVVATVCQTTPHR